MAPYSLKMKLTQSSSTTAHDFNMPFTSLHLSYFSMSLTHRIVSYVKVNYFVCVLCIPSI